jgi:hypothetical protein
MAANFEVLPCIAHHRRTGSISTGRRPYIDSFRPKAMLVEEMKPRGKFRLNEYRNLLPIILLLLVGISAFARAVRSWTEDELRNASQLIVIGTVTSVRDLDETNTVLWPGETKLLGVEATFAVSKVLKGGSNTRKVVLHYYRWDNPVKTSDPASAMGRDVNSPVLIFLTPTTNTKQYLLYLVSDGSSRYAPASGQLDTAYQAVRVYSTK